MCVCLYVYVCVCVCVCVLSVNYSNNKAADNVTVCVLHEALSQSPKQYRRCHRLIFQTVLQRSHDRRKQSTARTIVSNQLDAQFFFRIYTYLFQFSTCFEHLCAHHQENQLYQYDIWYMSYYVGDRQMCGFGWNGTGSIQTRTFDGHLHRVTYTRCIDTIDSPDDERRVARNM
jgi:hypothetical protein